MVRIFATLLFQEIKRFEQTNEIVRIPQLAVLTLTYNVFFFSVKTRQKFLIAPG